MCQSQPRIRGKPSSSTGSPDAALARRAHSVRKSAFRSYLSRQISARTRGRIGSLNVSAAAALAALIGGAKTVQSSTYGNDVGEGMKQLTVVIGLDHVSEDAPSPSETPAAGSDG